MRSPRLVGTPTRRRSARRLADMPGRASDEQGSVEVGLQVTAMNRLMMGRPVPEEKQLRHMAQPLVARCARHLRRGETRRSEKEPRERSGADG